MRLTKQEQEIIRTGTRPEIKKLLEAKLESLMPTLKIASDINLLKQTQGQVEVIEELISALD